MTDAITPSGLKEAIEHVQHTAAAATRGPLLHVDDYLGNSHSFIYSDNEAEYNEVLPYRAKSDTVSNVASFIRLVTIEAKRRANHDGAKMNVIFDSDGAAFTPDTDDRRDSYVYGRELSVQWKMMAAGLGRKMKHAEFILWLQNNRPSLGDDFVAIYQAFRVLSLNRASKLVSSPVLKDGQKGGTFEVQLEIKSGGAGGSATTIIPEEIAFTVPFARGDEKTYAVPVLIDIDGEQGDTPTIVAYAPQLDMIRDQAIKDEMDEFSQAVAGLPELAVLLNF